MGDVRLDCDLVFVFFLFFVNQFCGLSYFGIDTADELLSLFLLDLQIVDSFVNLRFVVVESVF